MTLYSRIIILLLSLYTVSLHAQVKVDAMVDLKGKPTVTVFQNKSDYTIRLKGTFFNWLPYVEHPFNLVIPPGANDSLSFRFNYPDFIPVNKFRVFNAPGKRVVCVVRDLVSLIPDIDFEGDFNLENTYYLNYNNFIGNPDGEGRPYYNIGDRITNFNNFPAKADSITTTRFVFLAKYQQPLSPWFKKYEYWRLYYNGVMRKYNVLASKIFYGGKPIPVADDYYTFENAFKLVNNEMAINTEYLWATDFYLSKRSKIITKPVPDAMQYLIDSLAGQTQTGDILKARRLGVLYTHDRPKYDSVFAWTQFHDPHNKELTDSLIQTNLGLPKLNVKPPDLAAKDFNGKDVFLSAYAGKPIIINFWAEWCGPCIAEFAKENQLYQQYKSQGLVIINVCIESDMANWKAISKKYNLQMINLFADAATYNSIKAKYNIGALPRSIAVGKDFKIIANYYTRASLLSDKVIMDLMNK